MSNAIYEKYKDIAAIIDHAAENAIQLRVMNLAKKDIRKYRIKDSIGGNPYLFSDSDSGTHVAARGHCGTWCWTKPMYTAC